MRRIACSILIISSLSSLVLANQIKSLKDFGREIKIHLGEFDSLKIMSEGEYILECYRSGQRAELYYSSSMIMIRQDEKGLSIADDNGILSIGLSGIAFRARFPNIFINLGDHRYRGSIVCLGDTSIGLLAESRRFSVFNFIDLEDYLKGVLPGEMGNRSEDEYEAVKAQAIAARTYAVWKLTSENPSSHLKNTIEDQLYLGAGAEMPIHNRAVEETKGLIMTWHSKPIAAYYHAVCGGSTAPREKIWGGSKLSYLKGVEDDTFCYWAKSFSWREYFTFPELTNNLTQFLAQQGQLSYKGLGKIYDLQFDYDKSTKRTTRLKIESSSGDYSIHADKIRWALKRPSIPGAILPSIRFVAYVLKEGADISGLEIVGAGNGHGVGMCQCGAIGRARCGQTCDHILKSYYRGIKIEKAY